MHDDLDHYCRIWGLTQPHKLVADRPTSQVYRVAFQGLPAVLKLLTPVGREDERHGAAALSYWSGRGAARLYRADDGAQLLEFVDGMDCVALVQQGRDDVASAVIGAAMARIHDAPTGPPPPGLTPLEQRFSELFDVSARPAVDPIFQRAAETARALLDAPLNTAVLHGDLHHENILRSSERGWLVIDPKGLLGETTYDGAMAILNPQGHDALTEAPERIAGIARILAGALNMPVRRLLRFTFAHACLAAAWSMESAHFSSAHALRIARSLEQMLAE